MGIGGTAATALEWLAVVEHELLLFAAFFFLLGAIDEISMDPAWFWLRLTGRAETPTLSRREIHHRHLSGRAAVLIPAWEEAKVIGDTLTHTMLLAAGYQSGTQSSGTSPYRGGAGPVAPGVVYAPEASRDFAQNPVNAARWSMDIWALWREDTTTPITSGRPSYGRSQVGAVLRYRLNPSSTHAPQLYLRASRSLDGAQESEVALGGSARPLAAVPVRLAAEARVSETDGGTEIHGAAYAVTEIPPVALAAGLTGEAYLQGGYVSGDFATPFIDGQARITGELAGTDNFRLTAGGGAWGGAQDDAQRLDIGPSAGVSFRIGQASGRVSADYRFRVAGDAEPSSGPALTLSAGF
jgi:hypothetical protein